MKQTAKAKQGREAYLLRKHGFFYRCAQRDGALPGGYVHASFHSQKRMTRAEALGIAKEFEKTGKMEKLTVSDGLVVPPFKLGAPDSVIGTKTPFEIREFGPGPGAPAGFAEIRIHLGTDETGERQTHISLPPRITIEECGRITSILRNFAEEQA